MANQFHRRSTGPRRSDANKLPNPNRSGTRCMPAARLHATVAVRRFITIHCACSSKLTWTCSRRPSERSGCFAAIGSAGGATQTNVMWILFAFTPIQSRPFECFRGLRIGHVFDMGAEGGEFAPPPIGHGAAERRVFMIGKIKKRRAGSPLLTEKASE